MSCCVEGLHLFESWLGFDHHLKERYLGNFYRNHPVMSRVTMVPLSAISGLVKVFLFPVICAIGIVAFPILAAYRGCKGEGGSLKCLSAWVFSIMGVVATAAFMVLTAYHMPLVWSAGLFVGICATSITIHVYKFSREVAPSGVRSFL